MEDDTKSAWTIRFNGIVQGVGFRPKVLKIAKEMGVQGSIRNANGGVEIIAFLSRATAYQLAEAIKSDLPPLARITQCDISSNPHTSLSPSPLPVGFSILESDISDGPLSVIPPPDATPCPSCLDEATDPNARRYNYAFTTCTDCGPRLSITEQMPFDRERTSMVDFPLCVQCEIEYTNQNDRRFHAQTLACETCGPTLVGEIESAKKTILEGGLLVIKSNGGFHLACDATNDEALKRLRRAKSRDDKPLAIMVRDSNAAKKIVNLSDIGAHYLTSSIGAIVVAPLCENEIATPTLSGLVAPKLNEIGVMLPPSTLHYLLSLPLDRPLVMTSANPTDSPTITSDSKANAFSEETRSYLLTHNRRIAIKVDDSVVRVHNSVVIPIRRSRGIAPTPIPLRNISEAIILGTGAHLKSTIAISRGQNAFISPHIGDLSDLGNRVEFERSISVLSKVLGVRPYVVAHDRHRDYYSSIWANDLVDVELIPIGHHHAHAASVMIQNQVVEEDVLAVVFDGTGLGDDGSIWGGEILRANLISSFRLATSSSIPMIGAEKAITEPYRMAISYLIAAFGDEAPFLSFPSIARFESKLKDLLAISKSPIFSPRTSGMGRFFDAVGALMNLCGVATFEGQGAMYLEALAQRAKNSNRSYPHVRFDKDQERWVIDTASIFREIAQKILDGQDPSEIALYAHGALVASTTEVLIELSATTNLRTVVLAGGCFQNIILLKELTKELEMAGFRVLCSLEVPPNDGGISLGQVAIAAARLGQTSSPKAIT